MGEKDKKELLEAFEKLDPVNRLDVLNHARAVFVAQENTKKAMKRQPGGRKTA
jgi:hypothetical protein